MSLTLQGLVFAAVSVDPALARRRGRGRDPRAERDGGLDRLRRRPPVVADGAPQGRRRARLRVLHQLRVRARPRELDANPAVSLLFPWHDLQRQVRVDGTASRVSQEESEAYFARSPARVAARGVGVAAVPGGRVPVRPRREVRRRARPVRRRWTTYPCRRSGAGSGSSRSTVEFWQGRKGRLHDRLRYRRAERTPTRRGSWSAWPAARETGCE